MIPLLLLGVARLAAAQPPPSVAPAPAIETVRWSGELGERDAIEIDNPRGDLRLRGAEGEGVELVAAVQRLGPPTRRARLEVTPNGDRLRVRVSVPEGERGRLEDRVDLVVLLPRRASVVARVGFGRLEARGLTGSLDLATVSGALALDLGGGARARSVSGALEVFVARGALAAGVELASGAGPVRVELDRAAEGAVEIRARDRILLDQALPFRREEAGDPEHRMRGRVGAGAGRLSIEAGGEVQLLWARAGAVRAEPGGAP